MDSNAARLFEVGVEVGLGDADAGACDEEPGTAAVRRGVEGVEDDGCLPSGILIDIR